MTSIYQKVRYCCAILLGLLLGVECFSQADSLNLRERFQYHVSEIKGPITVDGLLNEITWQSCEVGGEFWQKVPYFEEGADPLTEIRLAYDDSYLYIATKCYQSEPITITTLKRDIYWPNDGIAIVLDPLNTKNNSMLFGTSALGVQWDATRSPTSNISSEWSNKWFVETQVTETYWSAEFAIPLRILRYEEGENVWGMNFVRNLAFCNEYHNWTAVPEGFWPPDAAFTGSLIWDSAPKKQTGNFNLIPYISGGLESSDGNNPSGVFNAGIDAKVALTSALNLDITLNPDFSQIEADELVTNLTRFDIGLPEKRTFFLENSDVFNDFGTPEVRPFFSRRIGLDEDLNAVPILYGLRATGNLNATLRVGAMNIHSLAESEESFGLNNSAFAVKKQFGRSYIQGLFLNRQSYAQARPVEGDYGRNLGLEGLYQTDNGQWMLWGMAHRSFKPTSENQTGFYNIGMRFRNANFSFRSTAAVLQENFFADMGFSARVNNYDAQRDTTIRVGYHQFINAAEYQVRPRKGLITRHQVGIEHALVTNPDWSLNEQVITLRYSLATRRTEMATVRLQHNTVNLNFPFSFIDDNPLPAEEYVFTNLQLQLETDRRKALGLVVNGTIGEFYNGSIRSLNATTNFRIQPWVNFSVGYQINDLRFAEQYGEKTITALLSKLEIGFNKNLLWTTLFQYVDQSDFVGLNSRIQWRFSPMSDIFLVFVDNYDIIRGSSENALSSQNRALLLKVNYWY